MKKLFSSFIALILVVGTFTGCQSSATSESKSSESQQQSAEISKKVEQPEVPSQSNKVKIVVSNSILADMTKNVVGDKAEVYSIVPIGVDPHEYEPLPKDVEAVANADIIFYNGLNLETGGGGWFSKLMETAHKKEGVDYFIVSEGVKPFYLTTEGKEDEQDPHAWLDLSNGIIYVNNIAQVMSEKDPENKEVYTHNANTYTEKLEGLHNEAKRKFADIPADKKLLVSSEGAFKYFSAAYDVPATYIWEINTESQGTPEQMTHIIDTIRDTKITALFVETSIDPRSMEQVSAETGVPIYATIFTDSLAKEGEIGDNYYDMVKWNLDTIHAGLSGE